jgi:HAD superfamily hydrolase (TIGR01509 family)
MVEAVVFDLDGVLIDSEPVWEEVRRTLVEEHGGRWGPDTQSRIMGMNTSEWARYLSEELGARLEPSDVAAIVLDRMADRYRANLPLLPGAVEAVRRLAALPLAVASSSPLQLVELVLELADVASAFRAIVASDEVPRGKPAPDVYLLAARRLGVEPASSAAVEDSSNGIRSAAAAGFHVVVVPRPNFPPAPDALKMASLVLDELDQLTPESLERLPSRTPITATHQEG